MWKTRRNSFEDARGDRHFALPIKAILKLSGLKRTDIVRKEDLVSFWKMFLFCGLFFSIMMQVVRVLSVIALAWFLGRTRSQPLLDEGWFFESMFYFLSFGGIMGLMFSRIAWRSPQHAKAAMIRAGICPACGYQIGEVPVDADGCTICPECGAAWQLGDATENPRCCEPID